MFTLKIENAAGAVVELTHDRKNYGIISVQGLTRPPAQINTATAGTVDGAFYNSARLEMRNIVIAVIPFGDIEGNRQRLYDTFPLPHTPCTVYFENKNRSVKIQGYVETLEGDLFQNRETIQVSIICPRPYWQDLTTIYTELSQTLARFEFPFSITEPIPISEYTEYPVATVINSGDVISGLVIHGSVTGAVSGLMIYNSTTRQYIGFDYAFQSGDEITVSTLSGSLSARLLRQGQTINLMQYLATGSTWLKLALGENNFTFSTADGAEDIKITLETVNLYGGV